MAYSNGISGYDNGFGGQSGLTGGLPPGSYTVGGTPPSLPGFGPQYENPGAPAQKGGPAYDPWYTQGIAGLGYQSPGALDPKHANVNNPRSQVYHRAAQQVLQGAAGADEAMLQAYRDIYRARMGGAAAGQRQFVEQQGAEAAGMGLSPDLVRRLIANRQAQQAQMLGAQEGELAGAYQMARAPLIQQTGNTLASLGIDQLKWEMARADAKRAASNAQKAAGLGGVLGAVGAIGGAALGGPFGAALGGSMFGGGGANYGGYDPVNFPGTGPLR